MLVRFAGGPARLPPETDPALAAFTTAPLVSSEPLTRPVEAALEPSAAEIQAASNAADVEAALSAAEVEVEPTSQRPSGQRRHPRTSYSEEVVTLDPGADVRHVLVGCDLSLGGIRVERHPSISEGDRLHLALYDPVSKQSILADAEVVRVDGDTWMGLRFMDLDGVAALQIELLTRAGVGTLDLVSEPQGGGSGRPYASEQVGLPPAERDAPPAGGRAALTVTPELTESEIEELEARAAGALRSKGNYVSLLVSNHLEPGVTATGPAPLFCAPNEKRVRYEIELELTDEDRTRLEAMASAELRSISNFVAMLIVRDLVRSG